MIGVKFRANLVQSLIISMIYYYFYPACRGRDGYYLFGYNLGASLLWVLVILPASVKRAIGGLIILIAIIFVTIKKRF